MDVAHQDLVSQPLRWNGPMLRELRYDPLSRVSTLATVPAARASCTQRRGRAGRVAPGSCYRLYSRPRLESVRERLTPEIQRMELQHVCLQVA